MQRTKRRKVNYAAHKAQKAHLQRAQSAKADTLTCVCLPAFLHTAMASASARIQAVKAAATAAAATAAPEKDGDDMSLGSLDLRLAALAAVPLPLLPNISPPPMQFTPLQQLQNLIDQWGLSVWHAQKIAGTNTAVVNPSPERALSLLPCEDADWAVQKGAFIANMLHMKQLCKAALETTTPAASSSSAAAASSKPTSFARDRIRDYCQCRSEKPCSTRHCKCVQRGAGCTDACICRGGCMNKHPPASRLVGVELNPSVFIHTQARCLFYIYYTDSAVLYCYYSVQGSHNHG